MNDSSKRGTRYFRSSFVVMVVLMSLVGLITCLNQQFQLPLRVIFFSNSDGLKNTLGTLINSFFFLPFLIISPIARRTVNSIGNKKTLLRGLQILILSLIVFEGSVIKYTFDPSFVDRFHLLNKGLFL